jgi:plastocyanin
MQRNTCVSLREKVRTEIGTAPRPAVLRPVMLAAVLAVLVIALVSFTGTAMAGDKPPTYQVTIDNFSFGPMALTVPVGTEVTWVNHDDIPHTVVSEDKTTFKSRALDTDEKFSFTFTKPGTYNYFCSIHPKMLAKVVVQ